MLDIKDNNFFAESPVTKDNTTTCILKNNTYLGEVLNFLPHGRINKTETGIGATHLELESKRNSIIVQPLKVTAFTKAEKHEAFYYGSSIGMSSKKPSSKKLKDYLQDPSVPYKKIVVVADSLPRLVAEMGNISDYFLLIDEVDSLQTDSSFRTRMEACIEYYMKFDSTNRALVSATLLSFTNPDLESEPLTVFKYEMPKKRNIDFIHTETIDEVCFGLLMSKVKSVQGKLVVAYNSVNGCLALAETLVQQNACTPKDIKILCGKNEKNQAKLKGYYSELTSNQFPGRINFTTAAYFNGFDINEDYHLIVLSNVRHGNTMLSEHDITQISGRCRKTLLSLTVVHNSFGTNEIKDMERFTKDQLIKAAGKQIKALECISSHYADDDVLKTEVEKLREQLIATSTKRNYKFIKKDHTGKPEHSYLNIDAYLENQRVRFDLYPTPSTLHDVFKNMGYFTSLKHESLSVELVQIEDEAEDFKQLASEAVAEIRALGNTDLVEILIEEEKGYGRKAEIYKLFFKYKDMVEPTRLVDLLEVHGGSKTMTGLKNLARGLEFFTSHEDSVVKRNVKAYFKVGSDKMDTETLQKKVKGLFRDIGLHGDIDAKSAITILKTWVELKSTTFRKEKGGKAIPASTVEGFNPYGLTLTNGLLRLKDNI
jgi:hypothetical protein